MNQTTRLFLIILGLAILGIGLWYFSAIVGYVIVAGIVTLIGQPLVNWFSGLKLLGRFKIPRALAAASTLLMIWILIFAFLSFFVPIIARQAGKFSTIEVEKVYTNFEKPLQELEALLASTQNVPKDQQFSMENYASDKLMSILDVSYLSDLFSFFAGAVGDIFIAIFSISFISFFFLKDQGLFRNFLLMFMPDRYTEASNKALESITRLLKRYFIGVLIEVFSVITLITIGLSIIGLKFEDVIVIALFAGLMNVIPYLGPIIGTTFGIILGIASNLQLDFYAELLPLIGFMALVFISVQIIDNVVFQPLIYSSSVNAHPLEIFLVIMMAGSLAGITGMILAIPAYTILRVVAKEFFNHLRVVQKLTQKI